MRFLSLLTLTLTAATVFSAPDPVAECRAEHGVDSPQYVRCLEDALHASTGDRGDEEPTPAEAPDRDENATGLGAEQLQDAGEAELAVRIVATTYNARGLGTFRMEDGQVWRETTASPERKRLDPDRQYAARIVRAALGGYRMHVDGVRWMKTVERIE